jgi:transposase-like protein
MVTANCQHESLCKHGKDRKGCQRWKCRCCGKTVTNNEHERPLGDMRIEMDDAVRVVSMLLEGMSIRSCERITSIHRDTICDLVLHVGQNCDRFLEATIKNVEAKTIQLDEQWQFVYCKQKTAVAKKLTEDVGDSWPW